MKKTTIVILSIFFALGIHAQNIKDQTVQFDYTRLPSSPLENLQGYNFTVSTPYPENNDDIIKLAKEKFERDLANYPQTVAEAEARHNEALAQYEVDVETARENFKLEMEAWEKLSLAERMILADQGKKPVLRLPSKPYYHKPSEPVYQQPNLSNSIVYNTEGLSSTYFKLGGFEKMDKGQNVLIGTIVCYDFEYQAPVQKFKTVTYYDKAAKQSRERKEYYYETSYKRPTKITLELNGQIIYDGMLESTKEFKMQTSKSQPNKVSLERQSIEDVMMEANEFINNLYGFTKINNKLKVYFVKNKKGEYDDVEDAFNYAVKGYSNFDSEAVNDDIKEAIKQWKTILGESDVENKKARIDKKVTKAILWNLVNASLYTNNLEDAKTYAKQLEELKLSFSEKEEMKIIGPAIEDLEARLKANGRM